MTSVFRYYTGSRYYRKPRRARLWLPSLPQGPRQPPVVRSFAKTTFTGNGAKSTTTSLTWQNGDLITIVGLASSEFGDLPVPTITGGPTFAADGPPIDQTGSCWAQTWSARATNSGTATVDSAGETGSGAWGMACWAWQGSDGVGNRVIGAGTSKTLNLIRRGNESAVIGGLGDFSAASGAATYTPTVSNQREFATPINYTAYVVDWLDENLAANVDYGIASVSSTGDFAKVFVEVLGTAVTGQNIAVNQATETDLAQPIGRVKQRAVNVATTNELAQQIRATRFKTIGQAVETDLATAVTKRKQRTLAVATETDTGTIVGRQKSKAIGQASETDLATATTRRKQRTLAVATETDLGTAVSRQKSKAVNRATETDLGTVTGRRKQRAVGQAVENDLANPLAGNNTRTIGQAVETDTATAVARQKQRMVGQAVSEEYGGYSFSYFTNSYQGLPGVTPRKQRAVNRAIESDAAQAVSRTKQRAVNRATETDLATATGKRKQATVNQAVENDLARTIQNAGIKNIPVNRAIETDSATALTRRKQRAAGVAVETNTAFAFSRIKNVPVNRAIDTQVAQPIARTKPKPVNRATETDSATALARRKLSLVGTATETDIAQPILRLGGQEPEAYVRPEGNVKGEGGIGTLDAAGILRRDSSEVTAQRPSGDITRRTL